MSTRTLTIHRALAELKLIDSKIEKQIENIHPVGVNQNGGKIYGQFDIVEFQKTIQSDFDSVKDLIGLKAKIKSAIVVSNSKTQVTIDSVQMSVSDAITYKGVVIANKLFVTKLKAEYKKTLADINIKNDQVNNNLQQLLVAHFGKEFKADAEGVKLLSDEYIERNKFNIFDPLTIAEKIKTMEDHIANFESEVDAVLSESNAITTIEV